MEPSVSKMEEKKLIGVMISTSMKDGKQKDEIPPFFHKVYDEKTLDIIKNRKDSNQYCVFRFKENGQDFDYIIAAEVNDFSEIPENMVSMTLPSNEYVKLPFIKRGNKDGLAAFGFILNDWLPKSGYSQLKAPAFIYYDERFFSVFDKVGYNGEPIGELNIPITKK